jgi:hypothetical protein
MNSVKTTIIAEQARGVTGRLAARAGAGSYTGTGMVATERASSSCDLFAGVGSNSAAGHSTSQVGSPKDSIHMFIGVEGN